MNIHSFTKRWGIRMDITKIILPTPYPVGDVNAYLLKGDTLTLFDAGPKTEETYDALKWGIRSAGYDLRDVEQVVLTHHHPDHAGWLDAFPHADIYGHQYVDHWMRKTEGFIAYRNHFYRTELQYQGVPEDVIQDIIYVRGEIELFGNRPLTQFLAEGDTVPGHPELKVFEMPGHAQSHLFFFNEHTGEAIGGDLVLDRVSSNPLMEPPVDLSFNRPKSLLQYIDSMKRIAAMPVAKIYGGHGEEVTNAAQLVEERLVRQHNRAMKVLTFFERPLTVYEVNQMLFPKVYKAQPGLTLSETLGQLDYLESIDLLNKELVDGVHIYSKR